jgi:uncharacterized membrane protein
MGGVASMAAHRGSSVGVSLLGSFSYGEMIVGELVYLVVASFFVAGLSRFALKVARGEPYSFNDLFSGAPIYVSVVVANVIVVAAVSIGLFFLVIPGVIVALGLSMALPLIVDRGIGPVEALSASWKLSEGHKGNLFIFALLVSAMLFAGLCACFVGILLVFPIALIGQMYIYLKLTGQTVARVGPAA